MSSFGLSSHELDLDPSNKESVDGEEEGENPNDVDKGAVADKEVGPPSPSCLPHVQAVDVLLEVKSCLGYFLTMFQCSASSK